MNEAGTASRENRVLVFAPTANDAALTADFLQREGIEVEIGRTIPDLCADVEAGCGALLVAEEMLADSSATQLVAILAGQPAWSDLPIIIITSGGEMGQVRLRRLELFGPGGNVTLLERPFRPATLLSTVEVALRARRRQHEVRGLLRALESSEDRLKGILDSISDAFVAIDRNWRFTYVNPSYMRLVAPLYRSADDLLGQVLWEKFPDTANHDVGRFYREMMDAREPGTFEFFYAPLKMWLGVRAFPSPSGLSLYVQNVTEKKAREIEVAELNRKIAAQAAFFDATLSHIVDLVYSFDRQGRVLYANRSLLEVWGRPLGEVVGKNLFELGYSEELAEKLHNQLLEVVASGQAIRGEIVFRSASGKEEIHDYIYNPLFDESGEVTAVVGTTRLVTESRQAEGAMRRLAAIVRFSDDAIVSKNLDGVITSWNAGAERLFGYAADEIIGRNVLTLIPPERHEEEPGIVSRICHGEPVEHYETERVRKDGSRVPVSLTVSPIKDAAGKVVGASKIARDISEQKRIERDLKEAKDAAEAANRSKDHFLAVLSHELRTPLTPVLMTASALEMDPMVPPNLRADMAMIRRNVELETKLIDDLLDLSRITMGKLGLHLRMVDVNEAVRQVSAICEAEAVDRGVKLEIFAGKNLGSVRADPARLQQVLWNLLKNAIKFTPRGGMITVTTSIVGSQRVRVAVRDSGIGIPPQVLPKIFDAFEQGNAQVTRQFGGLGLGLAITKALVELHEGTISAESEGPNLGSVFTIDLPMSTALATIDGPDTIEKNRDGSVHILIVEDHKDTATMLAKLLGGIGYAVTVANTATDGLALAEKQPFDVVVSDLGLPDLTGYEFMRKLREIRATKGIAMSGYGMEEDIRNSLEAGFTEHLVKPVSMSSLEQAIRRLVSS